MRRLASWSWRTPHGPTRAQWRPIFDRWVRPRSPPKWQVPPCC